MWPPFVFISGLDKIGMNVKKKKKKKKKKTPGRLLIYFLLVMVYACYQNSQLQLKVF